MLCRVLSLLLLAWQATALHFYLDGSDEPRCVVLDLGKDALLAEKHSAWELEESTQKWVRDDNLSIEVTIDELFDNNHRVYSHKQNPFGNFQFVAVDGGEHKICYRALTGGWWSKNKIKMEVDFTVGTGDIIDSRQERQVGSLIDRIADVNRKLVAIKNEQKNLRDREASFRDQSESTNSQVTRLTVLQVFVLVGTCVWQVNHLRSFFTKQKLV